MREWTSRAETFAKEVQGTRKRDQNWLKRGVKWGASQCLSKGGLVCHVISESQFHLHYGATFSSQPEVLSNIPPILADDSTILGKLQT
jgi:hypothetical protein